MLDLDTQPITADERKMIEAKRLRDKQRRDRDGRSSSSRTDGKERSKSRRPARKLDVIDQLDATSIYGTGCMCDPLMRAAAVC